MRGARGGRCTAAKAPELDDSVADIVEGPLLGDDYAQLQAFEFRP